MTVPTRKVNTVTAKIPTVSQRPKTAIRRNRGGRDFTDPADHFADTAEFGRIPGHDDDAQCRTLCDQRAGIDHVETVGQRGVWRDGYGVFGNRLRFSGQRGFIDGKTVFVDQPDIGRDTVAGSECDNVSGDDVFSRNGHALAIADDCGFQ